MNTQQVEAMAQFVAEYVKTYPDCKIYNVVRDAMALQKIAVSLHKRYESACSYEWAGTEKYEKRTETLENKASAIAAGLGVTIGFQHDLRGWPMILKTGPYETRLG